MKKKKSLLKRLSSFQMSANLLKWILRFYGPYIGAGIKVVHIAEDYSYTKVQMSLRFYNKNYFGTHFGGSLYSMVDPFYCLMLVERLGKDYIVWDKGADIDFVSPGKGIVYAEFKLTDEEVDNVRQQAASGEAVIPNFTVDVVDKTGQVIARVDKRLYVRKKKGR